MGDTLNPHTGLDKITGLPVATTSEPPLNVIVASEAALPSTQTIDQSEDEMKRPDAKEVAKKAGMPSKKGKKVAMGGPGKMSAGKGRSTSC